jgi:hypothetical protein
MAGLEKWETALAETIAEGGGCIAVRLINIRSTRILLEAARNQKPGSAELRELSAVAELAEAPSCTPSLPPRKARRG